MAIDEVREIFDVTRMTKSSHAENQRVIEKWFPGEHGCIGGGTQKHRPLSDAALQWMIESMKDLGLGLEFDLDYLLGDIKTDFQCQFTNDPGFYKLAGIKFRDIGDVIDDLHETAIERLKACQDYRPKNLEKIVSKLNLN